MGIYTLAATHTSPLVSSATGYFNNMANMFIVDYTATIGSAAVAGAVVVFLDENWDVVTMNGNPGPFIVGDTPSTMVMDSKRCCLFADGFYCR